jgi:hypothetical protein
MADENLAPVNQGFGQGVFVLRTFVSFEADFPTDGHPAGRELADFLADAIRKQGFAVLAPRNREDWAWDITYRTKNVSVETIVGFSDDGPRQWQIHNYAPLPFFQRLIRRDDHYRQTLLRSYCEAIDNAIKRDGRFRTIRWYDAGAFDKDHGKTWGEAP